VTLSAGCTKSLVVENGEYAGTFARRLMIARKSSFPLRRGNCPTPAAEKNDGFSLPGDAREDYRRNREQAARKIQVGKGPCEKFRIAEGRGRAEALSSLNFELHGGAWEE